MEVILLQKVENLGNLGDKVKVRAGFGRNFLIPQGKATTATPANVAKFEARRAELETTAAETIAAAQARASALEGLTVTVAAHAGDEGKLFGSVGTSDIAEAATAQGQALAKHEVRLPAGPFRHTGEFEVELHLHTDVNAKLKLVIVAE